MSRFRVVHAENGYFIMHQPMDGSPFAFIPYRWYHALIEKFDNWMGKKPGKITKTGWKHFGDCNTSVGTGHIDIELYHGRVVGIAFRNLPLPFVAKEVNQERANDRLSYYAENSGKFGIRGVELRGDAK